LRLNTTANLLDSQVVVVNKRYNLRILCGYAIYGISHPVPELLSVGD
jgi:hypothetical protein